MRALKLALVLLLFASVVSAQTPPTVTAQNNTVYVGADGKFEANPDTALLQFNIQSQADTSKQAYAEVAKNTENLRQVLRNNGIDPKEAQFGALQIDPIYDWKSAKQKVVAYRVTAAVSLKLRDFAKIGPLVQQLGDSDIADNLRVGYTLENMDAAKAHAVEDAYQHARDNASAIARVSNRTLGELLYASVDTNEEVRVISPMAAPMRAMAAMPAPTEGFTPRTIQVTAHVNAMFSMK